MSVSLNRVSISLINGSRNIEIGVSRLFSGVAVPYQVEFHGIMKTVYMTILVFGVSLFLFLTSARGVKKSNYDKERDQLTEEQHKRLEQLEVQKRQAEAQEKKEKQQEEIRRINRDEHLRRHPYECYNARIAGHYGMKDGKPVRFVPIDGTLKSVLDEKRVLVYVQAQSDGTGDKSSTVVMVVLEKPQTFSKGGKFSVQNLIEAGTYGYSNSDGTTATVKMYRQIPGITLKEFLQLKRDGYTFPEETSS